ncbi:hypothetical protein HZA56_13745 [Candidatus Poribacteria bacterium]|nr:hypothetical protein [Candidatus Poribacteria bacterium]
MENADLFPLAFKSPRQRQEFYSPKLDARLFWIIGLIALWVSRKHGLAPELTDVYRTGEEQRRIYPNEPTRRSVHQFWRGCDIVARGLNAAAHAEIRDFVNRLFHYGKPGHETCIYHDVGKGWHLHVQVK